MTPAAPAISTITSAVSSLVTAAVEWIGSYTTLITGNPLLLTFAVLGLVGLGVGLIRRLMSL